MTGLHTTLGVAGAEVQGGTIQDPPSSLPLPLNTAGAPDIYQNHTDFTNSHMETVALYSIMKNVVRASWYFILTHMQGPWSLWKAYFLDKA